jgi:WD40 repeat protein
MSQRSTVLNPSQSDSPRSLESRPRPPVFRWIACAAACWLPFAGSFASAADDAVSARAAALRRAWQQLQAGDSGAARETLAALDEQHRGSPERLVEELCEVKDPSAALVGFRIPTPIPQFRLAMLNPAAREIAYLCDAGTLVVYDLDRLNEAPRTVVASRGKSLLHGGFSGDGKFFTAGDAEGGVTVWETRRWEEKHVLDGGTRPVRYAVLDKQGERLLAETEHGVMLWNLAEDHQVGRVAERYNFGTAMTFSYDDQHFATGGLFHIQLHDTETGNALQRTRHAPYTMHLRFSPDGKRIASGLRGSLNNWVGVFDVESGEAVFDRGLHAKGVTGLLFLDGGDCLLSCSVDGSLKFWDVPGGKELLSITLEEAVYEPSMTSDGRVILWNQPGGPRYFPLK